MHIVCLSSIIVMFASTVTVYCTAYCEWAARYFMNGRNHVTAAPPEQIFLTDCQQAHARDQPIKTIRIYHEKRRKMLEQRQLYIKAT